MLRRRVISTLLFSSFVFAIMGCGAAHVNIRYPQEPKAVAQEEVRLYPALSKELVYKEKSGKDSITKDNVTVSVDSIVSHIKNKDYQVELKDLEGRTYDYMIFPVAVVLKITNNTDHIVTLERTIVRLEDDNQVEYRLIDSMPQNKAKLMKKIMKMYDEYGEKIYNRTCPQEYLTYYSGPYTGQYDQMIADIHADIKAKNTWDGMDYTCCLLSSPFMLLGVKPYTKKEITIFSYSHITESYSPHKKTGQCTGNANAQKMEVMKLKQEAIQMIQENVPDNIPNIITDGVYPKINILPGRTGTVIAPFEKRKETDVIKTLHVGVYDLPTKVDEAANPTKRANFDFVMIGVAQ